MTDGTERLLAERLNAEPAIFRGCSSSELGMIVAIATLIWLPLGLILAWLAGAPGMGPGVAAIGIVASVVLGASLLQRLKQGRPEAYFWHRMLISLARLGLIRSPFVIRQGHWDLGRSARGER